MLRSPHAHALVRSIDATAARAAPGVLAVLTAAEAAADGLQPLRPYAEANVMFGASLGDRAGAYSPWLVLSSVPLHYRYFTTTSVWRCVKRWAMALYGSGLKRCSAALRCSVM